MQHGQYDRLIDNVVRFYTGYIQVHKQGYWEDKIIDNAFLYDDELRNNLARVNTVDVVVPRLESFALASFGQKTKGAMIMGIEPATEDALTGLRNKLVKGEYLTLDDHSVLVSEGLAQYLSISVADTLVLISQGFHGVNAAGKYPVKGIVKFPAPDLNNQLVYLPLPESQWFYGADQRLTSLALVVPDADLVDQTVNQIKADLNEEIYETMGWREMMPELVQQIELDYIGGLVMLFILYGVIAFGIFGTFLMMTNERTYEFGIMLAVGMKRYKLQLIMFMEILMLALLGTLLGSLLSMPVIFYFNINPIVFTGEYAEIFEKFGYEPVLSTVVILAIIAGIAALSFGFGFYNGFVVDFISNSINSEYSHIQLHHPEYKKDREISYWIDDPVKRAAEIETLDGVSALTSRTILNGMISSPSTANGIVIYGVDPSEEAEVTRLDSALVEGRYFGKTRNPILISRKVADQLKTRLRSKVVLTFQDRNGDIVAGAFRVAGIIETKSPRINLSVVYVRGSDLRRIAGLDNQVHEMAFLLENLSYQDTVFAQVTATQDDLLVESWEELAPELKLVQSQVKINMGIIL
ncbi:ABC transporter permease YtrF, partial [Durusdinium trenchii]